MKIFNEHLSAEIAAHGAELTSLQSTKTGLEYLWQADPNHWGRHAPILFPFIGKSKNGAYTYQGKSYSMGQHGFARDMEFEVIDQQGDHASWQLQSSQKSLEIFPFEFELTITYQLIEKTLKITYQVKNPSSEPMYFSIGGHPAFNCPMTGEESRSDYWLEWENQEDLITHRLNTDGLFSGETDHVDIEGRSLPLKNDLFDLDALVLKEIRSSKVSLCSPQQKWLTFHFEGFPYLGLWSKSRTSPFVCIEPWYGLADHFNHNQELTEKEGVQKLKGKQTFTCSHIIEIH